MEKYTDKSLLNAIGLSYGELSLKGKNRGQFERKLRNRINRNLKGFDFKLIEDLSKLYVLIDPKDLEKITEKLKKVFGLLRTVVFYALYLRLFSDSVLCEIFYKMVF